MIAALFCDPQGCYAGLPNIDLWDEARDARLYDGPWPVIAHPPCERWHNLSAVNHKRWGWRIDDDDGCFAAALAAVRRWGGVLEHPAESRAFKFYGIPEPIARGWQLTIDGDWVCEIDQATYGHRAQKRTWLLYHGPAPRPLDWRRSRGSHQIGWFDITRPILPANERAPTPPAFRDALISLL
jgi:hypothetical protein